MGSNPLARIHLISTTIWRKPKASSLCSNPLARIHLISTRIRRMLMFLGFLVGSSNPLARIHLISTTTPLGKETTAGQAESSNPLARIHLISTRWRGWLNRATVIVAIPLRGFISFQPRYRCGLHRPRRQRVAIPLRGFISFQPPHC